MKTTLSWIVGFRYRDGNGVIRKYCLPFFTTGVIFNALPREAEFIRLTDPGSRSYGHWVGESIIEITDSEAWENDGGEGKFIIYATSEVESVEWRHCGNNKPQFEPIVRLESTFAKYVFEESMTSSLKQELREWVISIPGLNFTQEAPFTDYD